MDKEPIIDYAELLSRAAEKDPGVKEILNSERDTGVNYEEEYRKQTGKDLQTGDYVDQ